MVKTRKLAF
ncbi:Protein of unknown function [Bacillus mycoides]|nr:Protein of unknown function [Bacillus mycoides]SCV21524.1 Protein of unknown function [Bacillus cereus]